MQPVRYIASLCLALASALAAPGLKAAGDGTMIDTTGALMWKRCSEGQRWTGDECAGAALPHTRAQARAMAEVSPFAGHDDWRLPTLDELRQLHRSVDRAKLPAAAIGTYWTATAVAHGNDGAFVVPLDDGTGEVGSYGIASPDEGHSVRLVRDLR
jgi:hypothetical protein